MREGLRVIGVGMHRTYDYFGGIRTVDVHVRRPRAKLGVCESMIGTVRQVGYKFVTQPARPR